MTEHLFSYGTLQKVEVQLKLFGRILEGTTEVLKGYRTQSIEIKDEAFLAGGNSKNQLTIVHTSNENDYIEGSVFKLTSDELQMADKYEPGNYKRIGVECESGKKAWIYLAV